MDCYTQIDSYPVRTGSISLTVPDVLCYLVSLLVTITTSGGYFQISNSLLPNTRHGQHPGPTTQQACKGDRREGARGGRVREGGGVLERWRSGGGAPSRLSKVFLFYASILRCNFFSFKVSPHVRNSLCALEYHSN